MFDLNRNQRIVIAALLLVHFVLLYLVLSRKLDFLFNDASHRIGPGSDFWALYNSGKHWRLGNNIYGQGPGFGFRYHPILAMTLLALLSHLKNTVAYAVWVFLNEFLFLMIWPFIRRLITDTRAFLVALAVGVFFTPYYLEVYMGNASFIAAALLIVAFFYLESHPNTRFYPLYLLSALIKPLALLFLPVLLFRKQVRLALVTVIIYAGLAIPYFAVRDTAWLAFTRVNFDGFAVNPGFMVHGGNQGFYTLILMISASLNNISNVALYSLSQLPAWNMIIMRLLPYAFVVIAVWATIRLRKTPHLYLSLFIWSATYFLGYKDIWEHSYSFFLLGLLCLHLSGAVDRRLLLICSVGMALPTAFVLYDISFVPDNLIHDPDWHWSPWISLIHHMTKPAWLMALYLVVMIRLLRGRYYGAQEVTAA